MKKKVKKKANKLLKEAEMLLSKIATDKISFTKKEYKKAADQASKGKTSTYNLLVYVEKCETKLKKFNTTNEMGKFIDDFYKKHPEYADQYSDYWIDYAVTDVSGEVHFFTDGLKVQ